MCFTSSDRPEQCIRVAQVGLEFKSLLLQLLQYRDCRHQAWRESNHLHSIYIGCYFQGWLKVHRRGAGVPGYVHLTVSVNDLHSQNVLLMGFGSCNTLTLLWFTVPCIKS